MELELLGIAGLIAFTIGGAFVMLFAAFRRTVELRGALLQAHKRIERLEAAVTHLAQGRPIPLNSTPIPVSVETPLLAPAEPAAPANAQAANTNDAPLPVAANDDAIIDDDRIDPPPLGVTAFISSLAAIAALAASRAEQLSGIGGVRVALFAGLVTLAIGEWRRHADLKKAPAQTPTRAPNEATLTAILGVAIIFGALLYGRWTLDAITPISAFLCAAALAFGAAWLSLRNGWPLLVCALIAAAAAPSFAALDQAPPLARYGFLTAFTVAALILSRRRQAPVWAQIAYVIALGWAYVAVLLDGDGDQAFAAGLYFAALIALGAAYGWDDAGAPLSFPRFWSEAGRWTEPMLVSHSVAFAGATCLSAFILIHAPDATAAGPAFIAMIAIAAGAGVLRPGYWLFGAGAAALSVFLLGLWPATLNGLPDAPALVPIAATLAFILALGGGLMHARPHSQPAGAFLAALAPIAVLIATQTRIAGFGAVQWWALAAAAIAGLNFIAYLQLAKTRSNAEPFVAGAALSVIGALYVLTPFDYAALTLAACLPMLALLVHMRASPGLKIAGLLLCALIPIRLLTPELFIALASPPQTIAWTFGAAAAAGLIAAFVFDRPGARPSAAAQASFALTLILAALTATLCARHAFTVGAIGAPYASLAEMGVNTLAWIGVAIVLAWRFGPAPRAFLYLGEALVFAAAAVHALLAGGLLINPWWGLVPAELTSNAVILLAYGAPAAAFAGYAMLRATQKRQTRAASALTVALALGFMCVNLLIRALFHGAEMATAPMTELEAWAYSLAWLGFAALLVALTAQMRWPGLVWASGALALAALVKTAAFDLSGLSGGPRLSATLALIGAAGALIWFYRRLVLPPAPTQPKTIAQTPPSTT